MKLDNYQTLVFDCDGVILNSNKVKTDAFFKAALPYGEAAARQLVEYHIERGGISRYKKFEWFLQTVAIDKQGPNLEGLLNAYALEVRHGLLTCEIVEGLEALRNQTPRANWLIVSGGDQQELREIFLERKLANLFNGGIFGSPDSKDTILAREQKSGNIKPDALFLGDSRYDHIAALSAGMDFIFLSYWTEFKDWEEYCCANKITNLGSLRL